MADEIVFSEGIYFNEKRENAPDFVLGSISVVPDKFITWLEAQKPDAKGYVKLAIKKSKAGKAYVHLDTWEPNQGEPQRKTRF